MPSATPSLKKIAPQNEARRKVMLMAAWALLWLACITARLAWLQIVRYPEFLQRAAKQQQRAIDVAPKRGVIYDRNGNALAMTIDVDSVFAVPIEIPPEARASTAHLLASAMQLDEKLLLERFNNPSLKNFTWVARKLDGDTAQRVHALNLRGIGFQKESKRFYPKHELAAQVLGGVGMDDKGLAGVELLEDESLHGIEGKMLISLDAKRHSYGRVSKEPEPGENLVLTIDEKIQYIAERELRAGMEQTHAEAGTIVVQNPRTGEILALANYPTFDPNGLKHDPKEMKNHAVSDVYEPGSTFKMVTIAGALDEHVTTPEEKFDCQMGSITFNGYRIHDWHPFGVLSVSGILENSSDVGAIKVALRLGPERFYKYIRGFGFGQKTGIELPGESRGMTKPVNRWSNASIGSISMGQEIAVTPIQLATMTSTMANDGIYTPARILAGVVAPDGKPSDVRYRMPDQRRAISSMTAAQMRSMLQQVVIRGTAKKAGLNGWTAAGKTGTAQKIDPKTHRYGSKDIASFAGFAPVNNPAVTVLVVLDSPVGAHHGGDTAAPIFQRITQQVLQYMSVPKDSDVDPKRQVMMAKSSFEEGDSQRLGALDFDDLDELAKENASGTGNDSSDAHFVAAAMKTKSDGHSRPALGSDFQSAITNQPITSADATMPAPEPYRPNVDVGAGVLVDSGGPAVPNFEGKTVRGALEAAEKFGIDIQVVGSGIARQQSNAPGSHLRSGEKVTVLFKR